MKKSNSSAVCLTQGLIRCVSLFYSVLRPLLFLIMVHGDSRGLFLNIFNKVYGDLRGLFLNIFKVHGDKGPNYYKCKLFCLSKKLSLFLALIGLVALPAFADESQADKQRATNSASQEWPVAGAGEAKRATAAKDSGPVEKIKVTGSRIKRIDFQGVSPVVVYSKEDLENSGHSSAGDFLRDTNISHFGVSREQAGSGLSGESFAALKREPTLVLINGVRVIEDPLAQDVDLNLIPIYAIERIEILKDGGAAIYGSDAVGGVINFITKKDFSGIELHAKATPTFYKGGSRGDLAGVFGGKSSKGSYIGSVSLRFQDRVESKERRWTNKQISSTSPYGVFNGQIDPRCPAELKKETSCEFNAGKYSTSLPRHSQLYTYFQGDYQSYETTYYTRWIGSYKNSQFFFPPVPGGLLIPAGHKMSLGAGQKGILKYRFMEAGNRGTAFNSYIGSWTTGAKGYLSSSWDYDISLKLAHIRKNQTEKGLLLKKKLSSAIHQGLYDPFNPKVRDLSSAKYTAKSRDQSSLIVGSADFSGESGFLDLDLASGVQAYFQNYKQKADKKAKAGEILSNAGGDGYGDRYVLSYYVEGIKNFSDVLEVQLTSRADFYSDSTALDPKLDPKKKSKLSYFQKRTQRATVNPKLAFFYKPNSKVLFRGSIGRAFVAPSLSALNKSSSESFPYIFDTVACYNELSAKEAFSPVYKKLAKKSDKEKQAFIKDFLIEQKDVFKRKGLSKDLKTELQKLSKSFPSYEYCKDRQIFTHWGGNKDLDETSAWVASLGSHIQFTDEHSLTYDIWYLRKSGIPSYGVGKKTLDAELKHGSNYVKKKSGGNLTLNRSNNKYNPLKSTPDHGITSKLLNLNKARKSGFDLTWDSDMSQVRLFGGSPYFRDNFSYFFFDEAEAFPGMGYVDFIGKWGSPRWRNEAILGWKNEKHDVSLTAYTFSSFAKQSVELEDLPSYTRCDLKYQFIISPKAAFKLVWSNLLFSDPPIDKELATTGTKIDHDIFEARGPYISAGLKYKL